MTFSKRETITEDLKKYCHMSGENSYIELVFWENGEGFDVSINSYETKMFSLTYGEFTALTVLGNVKFEENV